MQSYYKIPTLRKNYSLKKLKSAILADSIAHKAAFQAAERLFSPY